MKCMRRLSLITVIALLIGLSLDSPAPAQQDEAAALSAKVEELYRAGKFSEAIPLVQRLLAIREKALGPKHPQVVVLHDKLDDLHCIQDDAADLRIRACDRRIRSARGVAGNMVIAHHFRAMAYNRKGDLERAFADYSEARRRNPDFVPAKAGQVLVLDEWNRACLQAEVV